jgi:prepilin-type N-terminal cleavage/methylation domain-containing protein
MKDEEFPIAHCPLETHIKPEIGNRKSAIRSAFTLIEMLTTVAVLVIILGLMVSLARYVRDRSAQQLTRDLLKQLDLQMARYIDHNGGAFPPVDPILPPDATTAPPDATLIEAAHQNNEQFVRLLKLDYHIHDLEPGAVLDPFEKLPIGVYDRKTLRDAWGSPVVFMPGQQQLIGLAPSRAGQDQYFFFSAGPDRKYLTRDDNLYSYETLQRNADH